MSTCAEYGSGIFPVNFHTKWLLSPVHVRFGCAGSSVCSSLCALICVLLLCSHMYALICVLSCVCSPLCALLCALICVLWYVCCHVLSYVIIIIIIIIIITIIIIIINIIIIIITIIIIIITITTTSLVSFCPPTLFGVSCRDNVLNSLVVSCCLAALNCLVTQNSEASTQKAVSWLDFEDAPDMTIQIGWETLN